MAWAACGRPAKSSCQAHNNFCDPTKTRYKRQPAGAYHCHCQPGVASSVVVIMNAAVALVTLYSFRMQHVAVGHGMAGHSKKIRLQKQHAGCT